MKYRKLIFIIFLSVLGFSVKAQINTEQVVQTGRNALYFEDYILSIQYFNQAISAKPYLAQPYFYRAIAKINLEDYRGAEYDAGEALERNPFLTDAWEVRGVARHNLGDYRGAVEDFDRALELVPHNRHLLFNKAMALSDAEDNEGALETFNELTVHYPGFDNAYLGRARVRLAMTDTVAAMEDIDKALELNPNAANAYIMRADVAIKSHEDYARAEEDINNAIRLLPHAAGLYINRAFLRYNLNNYKGAMADYDYALSLDPLNSTALFNRGILLAEVSANDLALEDFNRVIDLDPQDYRALFNRALVLEAKGQTAQAIEDINKVIEAFPDFPGAIYLRGRLRQDRGELAAAERDFKTATAKAKALNPQSDNTMQEPAPQPEKDITARQFASLLTVDDNADLREEYNNTAIRGRIQNRNQVVALEPLMLLSFYNSPSELRQDTYYIKEVDELNSTRALRFVVLVTTSIPTLDESTIARHFQSVDYYNSYLATHTPRAVDYFGRAMDLLTVRDYPGAEKDINRGLALAPDFALGYFMRAQARYGLFALDQGTSGAQIADAGLRNSLRQKAVDDIVSDFDMALRLSPAMAPALYNKACVLAEAGRDNEAIEAFSKAIDIKADMGEAYYNRGYLRLRNGQRQEGIRDLSRAGELGIVAAYNLIKRMGGQK